MRRTPDAEARAPAADRGRPRISSAAIFLAGAAAALAGMLVAGLLYIRLGVFDVAASKPHSPLTYWVTRETMARSIKVRARSVRAPSSFTTAQVLAGFRTYEARCVSCHGAPEIGAREPWVDGMTPPPPYLVGAAGDWTAGELYWIIRHGLKMTGMPAWERSCSDAEIWSLVAFLQALPKMPSVGYRNLRAANSATPANGAQPPCAAASPPQAGADQPSASRSVLNVSGR